MISEKFGLTLFASSTGASSSGSSGSSSGKKKKKRKSKVPVPRHQCVLCHCAFQTKSELERHLKDIHKLEDIPVVRIG